MNTIIQQKIEAVKPVMDVGSVGITVGALFSWVPHATAFLSLIWVAIRIYETETIQKLLRKK